MADRIVVAVGGNAIQGESYDGQIVNVREAIQSLSGLLKAKNNKIAIVHGNGPQIGNILVQNAIARTKVPEMPMFMCGAMTQGGIGYLLQESIADIFAKDSMQREVASVITRVAVNKKSPAFKDLSKPVGVFYSAAEAKKIAKETGYKFMEDAGRGWRRVVSSPNPESILEIKTIRNIFESGNIVIACGGGGIPVVRCDCGRFKGVDAVIDKDKAAMVLANKLDANLFIILTVVEKVALNYKKENQEWLDNLTVGEARQYLREGHFYKGSMKPKIKAAVGFLESGRNRKVLITNFSKFSEALSGKNGTWIFS